MAEQEHSLERPDLNEAVREAWDRNAAFWDGRFGDGNDFQLMLIGPTAERLLQVQAGEAVLDVGCGNGAFSRRLAQLGAQVTAVDFSAEFLRCARARTTENVHRIEYRQLDATDEAQLLALGEGRFDAAVCNMALMDMAAIDPLFRTLPRLLRPGGRFVFTVLHPCFNHMGAHMAVEQEDRQGQIVTTPAIKVTRYIHPFEARGLGMVNQPMPQLYFHRPLHVLLGAAFRAGWVLDGLEEPAFSEPEPGRPFSWRNFPEIPPVLAARLKIVA